jgi:AcrR family transcriptional regulator
VPTLKHYFGDLDGVVAAALAVAEEEGAVHLAQLADPGDLPLEASLHAVVSHFVLGWRLGVGDLFEGALTHGLRHPTRGPAAVQHLLEPSLVALEARLAVHRARGQLDAEADLREAALAFLSPLMVGLLHQDGLGGARCRPLDVTAFGRTHVARFVRGWRPS